MMSNLYMDAYGDTDACEYQGKVTKEAATGSRHQTQVIREKLEKPDLRSVIERPRINDLLSRSSATYSATLISGRSGTGKTTAAALYANGSASSSWYSVTPSDLDKGIFLRHFEASLLGEKRSGKAAMKHADNSETEQFLSSLLRPANSPSLIVIDDIHHLFEADWFADFFILLLGLVPASSHLLITCRSRPPAPLWRMRSKQVLNVIDEKLLYFSADETLKLYSQLNLDKEKALEDRQTSYGHPAKLLRLATRDSY